MAIIHLQRRMVEIGRLRLGAQVATQRGGRRPVKLETWRLTSRDKVRLDAAASVFGGKVAEWKDRPGEWELVTETAELPVMLLPGQTLSQHMELWSGGGCKRRCDGVNEQLSDGPCLCDEEQPECKPHTRLNVMLPDVPGLGMWRLDSTGWNAARELAGTAEFLEQATARGVLLSARLRIDQRTQVHDGQTKKFTVPVLDVDIRSLDAMAIAGAPLRELEQRPAAELPAAPGHKPIAQLPSGVTVDEALEATARQVKPKATTARSAEPIGEQADFMSPEPLAVPDDESVQPIDAEPAKPAAVQPPPNVDTTKPSVAQVKKLNVLVGKLRDAGRIKNEHLWYTLAKSRSFEYEQMIDLLGGLDDDGVLHWSPLRDSLTKAEATELIDRLSKLEAAEAPAA